MDWVDQHTGKICNGNAYCSVCTYHTGHCVGERCGQGRRKMMNSYDALGEG